MRKRIRALAAALALSAALSGCGGFHVEFNPEALYTLPELPAKYTELNAQLSAILEDGAEYAAPASGSNIQPVQLTDLDGDGQQEAVAFVRKAEDETPLKIYLFSAKAAYKLRFPFLALLIKVGQGGRVCFPRTLPLLDTFLKKRVAVYHTLFFVGHSHPTGFVQVSARLLKQ